MEQGINMTINRLPAPTWNWLGMNETRLADISVLKKCPLIYDGPEGLLRESGSAADENELWESVSWADENKLRESGSAADENELWETMETGMGKDMDVLGRMVFAPNRIDIAPGATDSDPVILDLSYMPKDRCFNEIRLHAGANSCVSVVIICISQEGGGLAAVQTKIHAGPGAKVNLYVVQLLDAGFECLFDIGAVCEDEAEVTVMKLELGAGAVYAGGFADLRGINSAFTADIGYWGRNGQKLDMNYTVRHQGKKSQSRMDVKGILEDNASKLFRGTIDFLPGCAGAKGGETEDVLLLGEDAVNRTIPLILCGEEDVEGNHGATIGRLDERMLFYLASRGLPEIMALQLIARARMEALCKKIPSQKVQALVREKIGGAPEGGVGDEHQ